MRASQIIQQIKDKRKDLEFLATGGLKLDTALDGGFMRKELIILGGSTGIGKSYMSGQWLHNIARQGYKTAYFSLEISNEMVVSRLLGQLSNVKSTKVVTGRLEDFEEKWVEQARAKFLVYEDYMDFFDNIYEYATIEQTIRANQYDFVIIDFIQNVIVQGMDEYPKLSHVALSLQKLAKETNSAVVVLSQLSNFNARQSDEPVLEYKGSGSIATVADLGFFILRDAPVIEKGHEVPTLKLLLRKNRRGPSGYEFNYKFKHEGGYLDEYDKQKDPYAL